MTYNQLSESFRILSDWCDNIEELLSTTESGLTARVNLTEMREIDLSRLIELGWETNFDCNYLHLLV